MEYQYYLALNTDVTCCVCVYSVLGSLGVILEHKVKNIP